MGKAGERNENLILTHFTKEPFEFDPAYEYKMLPGPNLKPYGLWLSDESEESGGWKDWCRGNEYNLESLNHETRFKCDISKWLHLKNFYDITNFTQEYSHEVAPYLKSIDWFEVKRKYSGILITPYCWNARLHPDMLWYYGWDCASACVWDLSTIEVLPKEPAAR